MEPERRAQHRRLACNGLCLAPCLLRGGSRGLGGTTAPARLTDGRGIALGAGHFLRTNQGPGCVTCTNSLVMNLMVDMPSSYKAADGGTPRTLNCLRAALSFRDTLVLPCVCACVLCRRYDRESASVGSQFAV